METKNWFQMSSGIKSDVGLFLRWIIACAKIIYVLQNTISWFCDASITIFNTIFSRFKQKNEWTLNDN